MVMKLKLNTIASIFITIMVLVMPHQAQSTDIAKNAPAVVNNTQTFLERMISSSIASMRRLLREKKLSFDENFIGRCLGAARRLRIVLPFIVFKLGVIVTVLVFLTIFSLKSLALVSFLVMINMAKWFGKLTSTLNVEHTGRPSYTHQNWRTSPWSRDDDWRKSLNDDEYVSFYE